MQILVGTVGELERPRRMTFFATENPDDVATRRMRHEFVEPLAKVLEDRPAWEQELVLGEEATKKRLTRLAGGEETPALLFTATHGMGFAEVSGHLSNLLEDRDRRRNPEKSRVERIYRANADARNFVVLGDPAVRLLGSS